MKYVFINNLKQGNILAKTIFDNDCNILLSANSRLTEQNIAGLEKLGFKGLYIYDASDDAQQIDLLSDETRQAALKSLKHMNIDDCLFIANTITNNILEKPEILYDLMNICSYDNGTYMHCINVAILATMIGVDLHLSNETLCKLSQAALLHDIGKTCINERMINKAGRLTDEEYSMMKRHAGYGYNILKKNDLISEEIRLGILHHHENEDGSGYPFGLKGDKIPLFAKIIHVADVYDAMISKRSYKNTINPADVLEYMMGNITVFDISVIIALINCVTLYPIGTEVLLSDGNAGFIYKNIKGYPQRPLVKNKNGQIISLMQNLNITVRAIIT